MNEPTHPTDGTEGDLIELLQGDFYHWVDLWNYFKLFFETYVKPRKDLQLEGNFAESNDPFPKDAVLQILRVTHYP
jgi:E3 ubiquitin-protein ligase HUWE1